MRDVSRKPTTLRRATATASIAASPESIALIREGRVPKGDPLPVARVAAIQAAKNTSQLIPYCHPLCIDFASVEFELLGAAVIVTVEVRAVDRTGVEMEALTGAAVAALTIYDMLKMVDDSLRIESIELLEKHGGKSSYRSPAGQNLQCAVLVLSDSIAAGEKSDESGLLIRQRMEQEGFIVADYRIISDEVEGIRAQLRQYCGVAGLDLVLTTGGTGLGPRDNTPEATAAVIERELPGIAEALRSHGQRRTPFSMLSRGKAGVCGRTIIVNLPGSVKAVTESLDAVFPALNHAFKMLQGQGHGPGAAASGGKT